MKYGAGSDFAREVFARSNSVCMVKRSTLSPLSRGGALQARIPLVAKMARNNGGIESRDRFIGVLDVQPPAFDRCRITGVRSPGPSPVPNRLIMPGIDPPDKRFCIAVNPRGRTLTSPCARN